MSQMLVIQGDLRGDAPPDASLLTALFPPPTLGLAAARPRAAVAVRPPGGGRAVTLFPSRGVIDQPVGLAMQSGGAGGVRGYRRRQRLQPHATLTLHYGCRTQRRRRANSVTGFNGD